MTIEYILNKCFSFLSYIIVKKDKDDSLTSNKIFSLSSIYECSFLSPEIGCLEIEGYRIRGSYR